MFLYRKYEVCFLDGVNYIEGKLRPPSDEEDYETGKDDNIDDDDDDWDAEQYILVIQAQISRSHSS